jgi:hypothetical protein
MQLDFPGKTPERPSSDRKLKTPQFAAFLSILTVALFTFCPTGQLRLVLRSENRETPQGDRPYKISSKSQYLCDLGAINGNGFERHKLPKWGNQGFGCSLGDIQAH